MVIFQTIIFKSPGSTRLPIEPKRTMHHPLKDLKVEEDEFSDAFDHDDARSDITTSTFAMDDSRSTLSTRRSHMSLDPSPNTTNMSEKNNNSMSDLTAAIQIKAVPLRFINKPDFEEGSQMHLVQEIYLDYPVFVVRVSPCGRCLAVAGGDLLSKADQLNGHLSVFPIITETMNASTQTLSQLTAVLFNAATAIHFVETMGAVLDVQWLSRPGFLLTAGMDKQVSLWSTSVPNTPLMLFPHPDVVSSIAVHPKTDKLFVTGCIDGRLRQWTLEGEKVSTSIDLPHPITAVCFTTTGQSVVAGTASGHLYIYTFDDQQQFKYHSQIHVRSRRGVNAAGIAKVSGLQCVDGENGDPLILVTTNDSRVRLYRLRDKEVKVKFHGITNEDSQLKAVIKNDLVCCASEDGRVGLWKVPDTEKSIFAALTEKIRGRILVDSLVSFRAALGKVSESEENLLKGQPLSTAILLPDSCYDMLVRARLRLPLNKTEEWRPQQIVTADMTGRVKVFEWGSDLSAFNVSKLE